MATYTWVKVVGFSDVERHSINTLFRLSETHSPSYALWSEDIQSAPHVALIDVDSYEGAIALESRHYNSNLKHICVTSIASPSPTSKAWRTFLRPVEWRALIQELDSLFSMSLDIDLDISVEAVSSQPTPPGVKVALVVGLTREDRLYLRARLALAGITDLDEAKSAAEATNFLTRRQYGLVVVSLALSDADPWSLVRALKEMPLPVQSVVVATSSPTWAATDAAEKAGCIGLLEIPFQPAHVFAVLQKV
jgi:CheY-like chemotaxis protein